MTKLGTVTAVMQIVFYLSPLIIAGATLFLAWWRFKVFRVREPAITTDLQVTSRPSSPSYNALSAVVVLTNTSRVAVRVTRLRWLVRVLGPYNDAAIESKISEYAPYLEFDGFPIDSDGVPIEFPWSVNYTISQVNARISLEPGESNTISMSLAIPRWIEAVDVLVELDSPPAKDSPPLCWAARRQHDINREVRDVVQIPT